MFIGKVIGPRERFIKNGWGNQEHPKYKYTDYLESGCSRYIEYVTLKIIQNAEKVEKQPQQIPLSLETKRQMFIFNGFLYSHPVYSLDVFRVFGKLEGFCMFDIWLTHKILTNRFTNHGRTS